jgi:hypothetical protein
MHHTLRDNKAFPRCEANRSGVEVNQKLLFHDIKELVIFVVLMPMVLTLDDAKPYYRFVHLA